MSGGKVIERNGDKFLVTQPMKESGYKKYPTSTATNYVSTTAASYVDPCSSLRGKKKLEVYRPNSARNRLPVHFKGDPKPYVRHCKATNVSNFSIGAPDQEWDKWKKKVTSKRSRPLSAA